jgi:hypothetical protein
MFVDNLRPEARGPLKSGAWGGRPICHPQTPPVIRQYYEIYKEFRNFLLRNFRNN